jgi:hypothetical protein
MERASKRRFIKKTEDLVKPIDVTAISFLGNFNRVLSKKSQQKILRRGSRNIPYLGFIVDPYCFFLSYEIKNIQAAESMLPEDYELLETTLFTEKNKKPCVIIGIFSARTSAFIGTRLEVYLIARRKSDGKAAWIIVDYATNTNSYDPARGFSGYNSDPSVYTTTPFGELLVDIQNKHNSSRISLQADLTKGRLEKLYHTLWVEGNLTVDYGGAFRNTVSSAFSLIFDPAMMKQALCIPLEHVKIEENSYCGDLIDADSPVSAACFPYSQHYIIKQNLPTGEIQNEEDLEAKLSEFVNAENFKTMRGADIKKPILIGIIISAILNYGLIIFLLFRILH